MIELIDITVTSNTIHQMLKENHVAKKIEHKHIIPNTIMKKILY